MSEYAEALSRLNAQERPPHIKYIKHIPYSKPHDYTTEESWNQVFMSGRNSKLPRYSISQRFVITENDLGKSIYSFPLDNTFVTAKGDRKSIAVRSINFEGGSVTGFVGSVNLRIDLKGADFLYYTDNDEEEDAEYKVKYIAYNISYTQNNMLLQKSDIRSYIFNGIIHVWRHLFTEIGIAKSMSYSSTETEFLLKIPVTPDNDKPEIFSVEFTFMNEAKRKVVFNQGDGAKTKLIPSYTTSADTSETIVSYSIDGMLDKIVSVQSVCSTINPYSIGNIIGSPKENHDMLNKIYPYDRQTDIQLWFNNADSERLVNNDITGYLDLELIVDNSNNLTLDI